MAVTSLSEYAPIQKRVCLSLNTLLFWSFGTWSLRLEGFIADMANFPTLWMQSHHLLFGRGYCHLYLFYWWLFYFLIIMVLCVFREQKALKFRGVRMWFYISCTYIESGSYSFYGITYLYADLFLFYWGFNCIGLTYFLRSICSQGTDIYCYGFSIAYRYFGGYLIAGCLWNKLEPSTFGFLSFYVCFAWLGEWLLIGELWLSMNLWV